MGKHFIRMPAFAALADHRAHGLAVEFQLLLRLSKVPLVGGSEPGLCIGILKVRR